MEHTLRQLEIDFDGVTWPRTPAPTSRRQSPFERALHDSGVAPGEVLHVAFGFKYDIGPAQQLGMRTAWVNRHKEEAPGSERPDHEWTDLWPLASVATGP